LGRGFSYALLQFVAALDEGALQSALQRLAEADILFVEGDGAQATYRFKHALIQDAAYDSLLKSRRQALHAQAAEILRDSASPEPEAIAHHFTQAGLDDLAIEWWGKAGDQALRRSAFQEAIAHLGKAIAMADKAGGAREPAPAVAQNGEATVSERSRRQRLQVAYGNALIAARGHSASETTEAFAKVRESGAGGADVRELAAADYGLWVASYGRGELPPMRVHSAAFLEDVAARPDSVEACVAHRVAGSTHWFAGEYREAREHLERAVALFQPGRDDDVAFRFGQDVGVAAMHYLAIVLWVLGDVARAIALAQQAHERIERIPHANTRAYGKLHMALFELIRGEVSRAVPNALELGQVARENDLPLFRALAVFLEAWAKSQTAGSADAREEMSRAADVLRERNIRCFDGPLKLAHAQEEARLGDLERAISIVDDAMADFDRRGHRAMDAELHRVRGEILLKRDPANPGPAEEALKAAIAMAQQQGARSFELRAALSLAKLYQSTGRDAEAHAVLAPALEGFSPTPEMPEIAEAQALLATLSQTDEVKAQAAQRHRMTQLQVAYGNALIAARGFGAPETAEAFERARQSAFSAQDTPERLAADFGLWAGSYTRGELPSMRAQAAAFLADVEARPDSPEAGVAHRVQGITHWFAGEFVEARDHLERALALFEPGRDDDLAYRFGMDPGVPAMAYLAFVLWSFGEIDCALSLAERMRGRTAGLTHANTLALGTMHAAAFELMRGDRPRIRTSALELARIAREHDLRLFRAFDDFFGGWMAADDGALPDGIERMRRGAENLRAQNALVFDGLLKIALSEAEARAGDLERAVATLDEALATTERAGFRAFEAELNRTRGEVLLECDPANPAPAQEAFQRAIAVAKRQSTRSFELRAALSLAKLYQSSSRPADARAVLSPALEGFEPTPEMPEIAQAQALLAG
jgi:tetratricopeptide (TPR) repeat protein